ncbi:hypothetical protein V2J09_002154 [Rumex salicifolius]
MARDECETSSNELVKFLMSRNISLDVIKDSNFQSFLKNVAQNEFCGVELPANLIRFNMKGFDVILGMDWLSKYSARIDCRDQKVSVKGPEGIWLAYKGIIVKPGVKFISVMKARSYLRKGLNAMMMEEFTELGDHVYQPIRL